MIQIKKSKDNIQPEINIQTGSKAEPKDKMPLLHIDGRMLYSSGIGRFLRETLKEITAIDKDIKVYLYCSHDDYKRYLNEYAINTCQVIFKNYCSPIYSVREQIRGSLINLKIKAADILYFPHYNLPLIVHKNSIITIHDFIQFKFPEYFGKIKVKIARLILNNAAKKAKKIIVVSKSTRDDFCSYFPAFKDKVEVIYNGISKRFKILEDKKRVDFLAKNRLKKYILFIGNNKPHKNISGLVNSFIEIKKEFTDFELVIISKGFNLKQPFISGMQHNRGHGIDYQGNNCQQNDLQDNNMASINEKNIAEHYTKPGIATVNNIDKKVFEDIIVIDEATDDELLYYYNCAYMLVMPSFYEGFGLPVVEAMACGCPVVASNKSSLPELCGHSAILVDPYDKKSLTEGIKKLIIDNDLRQALIKKGIERAQLFSWQNTAKKYLEVFRGFIS